MCNDLSTLVNACLHAPFGSVRRLRGLRLSLLLLRLRFSERGWLLADLA